jgi:hypothetical protein
MRIHPSCSSVRTLYCIIPCSGVLHHPIFSSTRIQKMSIVSPYFSLLDVFSLSGVFKAINSTVGGILSLGELLDMAGKLEMFLTEEEGSRIFALMDIDNDEKVSRTSVSYVVCVMSLSLSSWSHEHFSVWALDGAYGCT